MGNLSGLKRRIVGALGLGCLFAAPHAVHAAFLSVDFQNNTLNGSNPAGPTQSGFSAFGVSGTAANPGPLTQSYSVSDSSVTSNSVTVLLADGITKNGSGDYNSTAAPSGNNRNVTLATTAGSTFTYQNLYQDFAFGDNTSGNTAIELSGLNALTSYTVTFYAYDNNASRTLQFNDFTSGSAVLVGTLTTAGAHAFASNSDYALPVTATTDSSGRLLFYEHPTVGTAAVIDGLQVSATPEPGSLCLLGIGAGWLAMRRRGAVKAV